MISTTFQHSINLQKSPLSGSHITSADMRRRLYADKCERMSRLAQLFNDEAWSLNLELWDTLPSFEARGATLVCHWTEKFQTNLLLCDRVINRIQELIDSDSVFNHDSAVDFVLAESMYNHLKTVVRSMKEKVQKETLYVKKCG